MPSPTTETPIYVGKSSTDVNDGYVGLRKGQRYTGVVQADGQVLVSAVEYQRPTDQITTRPGCR